MTKKANRSGSPSSRNTPPTSSRSPVRGLALWGAVLALGGVWAYGTFVLGGPPGPVVATVGGSGIPAEALKRDVQATLDNLREQAVASGTVLRGKPTDIAGTILERMVASKIVDLERQRLHLVIDDKTVDRHITQDGRFKGANEVFDHAIYAKILEDSRLSESRYKELLGGELARARLVESLSAGMTYAPLLAEALYRARDEKRVPDTVFLARESVKSLPEPAEKQLAEYYESHKDRFRDEYRSFTLAVIGVEDLEKNVAIPDERLKEEYEARLSEMKQPEQRELLQLIAPDETTARKAAGQIAQGKDFVATAKEIAHEDESVVKLGWVRREDLEDIPQIAAAAFGALREGEVSPVLRGPKGWHLLKVAAIRPPHTLAFEEAKDKLARTLAENAAAEELVTLSKRIKASLAGGASLEEVAKEFHMRAQRVDGVNAEGRNAKGEAASIPLAGPTGVPDILREAFLSGRGETSRLAPAGNDTYFLLRLEDIAPPVLKPLAEIREKVKAAWQEDARNAALMARATELAHAVTPQKTLAMVAQEKHLPLVQFSASELFRRSADDSPDIPQALVARLFALKPGEAAAVPVNSGVYVVGLAKIIPASVNDKGGFEEASESLRLGLRKDLMAGFTQALHERYPVSIRQDMIDKMF